MKRFFDRLRKLLKSERGNVLAIGAATLPLLMGSTAFAVDTIQLSLMKRQLQRAADSSAIAGAYAYSQSATTDSVDGAVHRDLDKNNFPALSQAEYLEVGPRLGFERTVYVRLVSTPRLPFMSIFTGTTTTVTAEATAALVLDGEFCMVSLYDGDDKAGIDVGGNADVTLGCGMKTNSGHEDSVTAGGTSSIAAEPIASRGGLDGSSNNFVEPTTLQPYSATESDPLGHLPNPSPDPSTCTGTLTVGPQDVVELPAGDHCYASILVQGSLTIAGPNSTLTAYGGDIDLQGSFTADGITVVMTGANGAAGDLKINAQAALDLSSPASGTYKGVLFYRDRRAANIEIKINGGANMSLTGALYFPSSDITMNGGADMNVQCLQMVGQILKFNGGADVTNECPDDGSASAFQQTVVRLVG